MRRIYCFVLLLCQVVVATASPSAYLDSIRTNPKALYAFFKKMPKGGELHYHFGGSVRAENMLAYATEEEHCIDVKQNTIGPKQGCRGVLTKALQSNAPLYDRLVRAWSMKDQPKECHDATCIRQTHDHFFAAFSKFAWIQSHYKKQILATLIQNAAAEHVLYLEIIYPHFTHRYDGLAKEKTWAAKRAKLLANPAFLRQVKQISQETTEDLAGARELLHCDHSDQPACQVVVKFQAFVRRSQSLDDVFTQALAAFLLAKDSNDVVGVNLVEAEDGAVSLRDYRAQMRIFSYLHHQYPDVHIALHAGELVSALVKPAALKFHIHDAIFTGQAERIGHGVDIRYENNSDQLMDKMAHIPIPVEVNLTSSQSILSISGHAHPLKTYLQHGVPVVLSTDDAGILRTDLTKEYVRAFTIHHLDYAIIKQINRNALTYAFLPGKSLWDEPACKALESPVCQTMIKSSLKAQLQLKLERQLSRFESDY